MKRLTVSTLILLALLCATAGAQDKPKTDAPPPLTLEQQQQLAQAVTQARTAQLEAEAAKARYEAEAAKAQALVFRIMATLKVSPEEYDLKMGEGGFVLVPRKARPPQ